MSDSTTLHALTHHAKPLYDIVAPLSLGFHTELQREGWVMKRRWSHCYSIHKGDKEFHFRYGHDGTNWCIDVYDGLPQYKGKKVVSLTNRAKAFNFIRRVKAGTI